MLIAQHSETTSGDRMTLWRVYADVAGWPAWDHAVAEARLDGPFKPGTGGTLVPTGGIGTRFRITWCVPGNGFTLVSDLPLARIITQHCIEKLADGGARFTHRVDIEGPLAFFFSAAIGAQIRTGLRGTMQRLAMLAALAPRPRPSVGPRRQVA